MKKREIRVAVITASDQGFAGKREDVSGAKIIETCLAQHFIVVQQLLLPDEEHLLSEEMKKICDEQTADLILTTGGTGFSPRDCTPEATLAIADKLVPGIPEAMRYYGLQITKRAMLSRGTAVIRKQTLIVNLPGSVKSVEENLSFIIDQLPHAVGLLKNPLQESGNH